MPLGVADASRPSTRTEPRLMKSPVKVEAVDAWEEKNNPAGVEPLLKLTTPSLMKPPWTVSPLKSAPVFCDVPLNRTLPKVCSVLFKAPPPRS